MQVASAIAGSLEAEFQTQLDLARVESGSESQGIGRTEIPPALDGVACHRHGPDNVVDAREIHAVEQIESLEDSLQAVRRVVPETECLGNAKIKRQ